MSNNKIYLNHLNPAVTNDSLREHFAPYGQITDVNLPRDKKTHQPKGYAFITFAEADAANKALDQDGKTFLDQEIVVQIAIEKKKAK